MATITESFNTADSDTLGPDLTWTELANDADVVSNACQFQTFGASIRLRADSDLATVDHYAETVISACTAADSIGQSAGPIVRKDSSATLSYYFARLLRTNTPSNVVQLFKVTAGTAAQIGSNVTVTVSLPNTVRLEASGTTTTNLRVLFDGVEKINANDSSSPFTTGKRCGIHGFQNVTNKVSVDSFAAGDLSAASGSPWYYQFQQAAA